MSPAHLAWIAAYEARLAAMGSSAYSRCKEAVAEMREAFPELSAVPGHVETVWGRREHWWLVTPDGDIVDPTVSQFPAAPWFYDPLALGTLCRAGKCMNCGDEIWTPATSLDGPPPLASVCGPDCEEALRREYA